MTDPGERLCPGPHWVSDQPPASEPLCPRCQVRLRRALEELPARYVDLTLALAPGRRGQRARVQESRSAPLPIATGAHELMAQAVEVALSWAEVVRDVVGLSDELRPRRTTLRRHRVRMDGAIETRRVDRPRDDTAAAALAAACATLAAHVPVLLALPPTAVVRRVTLEQLVQIPPEDVAGRIIDGGAIVAVDLDGAQAGVEILDLAEAARRYLGHTRGKDRLPAVCPSLECGAAALVRWHGASEVTCEQCGRTWPEEDYRRLVIVLAAEQRRQGLRRCS